MASDEGVAEQTLSEVMAQASLEVKKTAVREAVDSTNTQRAARELITVAMDPAPEATEMPS